MQGGFGKVYNTVGVERFYTQKGSTYHNPHQYDIQRLLKKRFMKESQYLKKDHKILDLACGSGEVTLALKSIGYKHFQGIDPYTYEAYKQKTGLDCQKFNFIEIMEGALQGRKYDAIIISYALHLVKDSMLYEFCNKLTESSQTLIVVAPHKFPLMKDHYGWKEVESTIKDKIHLRIYKSIASLQKKQQKQQKQEQLNEQ